MQKGQPSTRPTIAAAPRHKRGHRDKCLCRVLTTGVRWAQNHDCRAPAQTPICSRPTASLTRRGQNATRDTCPNGLVAVLRSPRRTITLTIMLLQRCNLLQRLALGGTLPVVEQFRLVEIVPLQGMSKRRLVLLALWKSASWMRPSGNSPTPERRPRSVGRDEQPSSSRSAPGVTSDHFGGGTPRSFHILRAKAVIDLVVSGN